METGTPPVAPADRGTAGVAIDLRRRPRPSVPVAGRPLRTALAESHSVCLVGGLLLGVHARRFATTGALLGLLLLTKPGVPLVLIVVLACVVASPADNAVERARAAAIVSLTAAVLVVPWMVRNHRVVGSDGISTSVGSRSIHRSIDLPSISTDDIWASVNGRCRSRGR